MSNIITSKVSSLLVMEPLTIIRDSLAHILCDSHCCYGVKIKTFSSFKELMRTNISGTIITEVYDNETSLIEGVITLRQLKKKNPHVDFIIVTNVDIKPILAQANADLIISKNISIECLRFFLNFTDKKNMINLSFHNASNVHLNYECLSDFELNFLSYFTSNMTIDELSAKTGVSYRRVSRVKNSIMKKIKIRNKVCFSKLLTLLSKKYGEGCHSNLVLHSKYFTDL